jgi:hypothetical protein
MERRLESIHIKYWERGRDPEKTIRYYPCVVLYYRNIIDGIPTNSDLIVIQKDTDYSNYEEKIQQICQIAFEEQ